MELQELIQIAARNSYEFVTDPDDPEKIIGFGRLGEFVVAALKDVYEDAPYDNDTELMEEAESRLMEISDELRAIANKIAGIPNETSNELITEHLASAAADDR